MKKAASSESDLPEQEVSSARQTHSYLRDLMDKRGLSPKNKLGQNFLIDHNLIRKLVDESGVVDGDLVLLFGCVYEVRVGWITRTVTHLLVCLSTVMMKHGTMAWSSASRRLSM